MITRRIAVLAASILFGATAVWAQTEHRSAYTYIRDTEGQVTVVSGLNGTVDARRNLPVSAGDELRTDDPGRAEVALADGNVLDVGGGTSVQFVSLNAQQGSDDSVSALSLKEGSVVLSVLGSDDKAVPRIDTDDLTVYANPGARVRVNADSRRGSAVVVRAGSVEVRSPSGSYTVRAGNYLLTQGEEEPEISRGSFSRDRFDLWVADRFSSTYEAPQSASSQYVGEDYAGDVSSLDDNGNWDYNSTYSNYVWRPNVGAGWTPYSNGSWYYTPAGLTWWSYDPWGWYPFHYGNWFFDTGWNSWCWSPGYVYSPAWVYWGYTSGYVGWCPLGWYGFYSPWWNSYYRQWSYPRGCAFAINGTFSTHRVDLRGWNFTGSNGFGTTRGRLDVIPGTRVADRLGSQVAISSRPIVLPTRNGVGVRDSMRDFVRDAPRAIDRSSDRQTQQSLEPVVARDRQLPQSSVDALRDRAVVADRGVLRGPGAADVAPRGATIVERGGGSGSLNAGASTTRIETDRTTGRTVIRGEGRSPQAAETAPRAGNDSRGDATQAWRSRGGSTALPSERSTDAMRQGSEGNSAVGDNREQWRTRSTAGSSGAGRPTDTRRYQTQDVNHEEWRSRGSGVPPARRVIEGSVPGRRTLTDGSPQNRERGSAGRPPAQSPRDRDQVFSAPSREVPAPSAPRGSAAPPREAPAPPSHAAPPPSSPRGSSAPPSGSSGRAPHGHERGR